MLFRATGQARVSAIEGGGKLDAEKKTRALTRHNDPTNTIAAIRRTLRSSSRISFCRYLAEGRTHARQLSE
jgi:hypothetical protein